MSDLVEQLRAIEESLRDRAYDALRAAAIEKAIRALDPISSDFDEGP
jgi:hypothetical protein